MPLALRILPYVLVFFSSMCIMILELVASRLVAWLVGGSLIVWTSVIGVMLAGICLGNVLGGRLADRIGPMKALGPLYAIGAALTLSCLWANSLVSLLPGLDLMAWDLRTLVVVVCDFLLPTTFLGMISPVTAKMAVDQARHSGSAIGDVYFFGAVGSIVGTFFAGYVLIAVAPHTLIVIFVAVGLALLAAGLLEGFLGKCVAVAGAGVLLTGALLSLFHVRLGIDGIGIDSVMGKAVHPIRMNAVSATGQAIVGLLGLIGLFKLAAAGKTPEAGPAAGASPLELDSAAPVKLGDLAVLSFIASLAFMAFEMVAGRLVTRHLGSSIYGWTSVIGVLLGGLSLGNLIGGKIADHVKQERQASWLFLAASFFTLGVLVMEAPPVSPNKITLALGKEWPNSSLLASALTTSFSGVPWGARVFLVVLAVFFLPSVALGTVSPVVAKLAVDRVARSKRTGTAIGQVYAWGMVGSILGTFLTGFFLIELLGTKALLLVLSAVLALAGAWLGNVFHAAWAGLPLALCVLVIPTAGMFQKVRLWDYWPIREERGNPQTKGDDVIAYANESKYYYIKVTNEIDPLGMQKRVLVLDSLIHGYCIIDHPERLDYDYEHIYALVAHRALDAKALATGANDPAKQPFNNLFLGGGSYTFPRYILNAYPNAKCEVAEIDPAVNYANRVALNLARNTPIKTTFGDARQFVEKNRHKKKFDFIFGDAFNDFSVPWHLTTKEFNDKISDMLTDDGIYMINIIDIYQSDAKARSEFRLSQTKKEREPDTIERRRRARVSASSEAEAVDKARKLGGFLASWTKTARLTFPNIYVFGTNEEHGRGLRETFVVVASKKPLDVTRLGDLETDPEQVTYVVDSDGEARKVKTTAEPYNEKEMAELEVRAQGILLRDDYAPVENLLAPVAETRGSE